MNQSLTTSAAALRELLGARLKLPLPPEAVRARFAPALSYGRHFGPAAHDARPAAVMVLFYPHAGEWHIPLTARPATMLAHAGQVSFPGGMVEPGESTREAALRELDEELGMQPPVVEMLASLSPLYLFATNFLVTPWVAIAPGPVEFHPCDREVAEVLEVPVRYVLDAANYGEHRFRRGELDFTAPHMQWGQHRVWGATAIILAELVALLADVPAESWNATADG